MASFARPRQSARRSSTRRSWPRRILGWIIRLVLGFILLSLLMVVIYRFVPPPITLTQLNELAHGHMVDKDWM
ncbi:MAG TPA: monofunctional biosynthetic peptidoglycan transglycosylase, partial [Sphingomonas sp.]|nr:monofunctional biosynthetic peptidoglycan transglycosylase [Sphingomonas sp.]